MIDADTRDRLVRIESRDPGGWPNEPTERDYTNFRAWIDEIYPGLAGLYFSNWRSGDEPDHEEW